MATRNSYAGDPTAGDVLTAANFKKLPGGWLATLIESASTFSTSGTTPLTVHTQSTPVDASRMLKVTWSLGTIVQNVVGDVFKLDVTAAGAVVAGVRISSTNATARTAVLVTGYVTTSSAGNVTYAAVITRLSGTGTAVMNCSLADSIFMVEDIGPSS
jgi:hypothetical protein